jgi:hypothetical protein
MPGEVRDNVRVDRLEFDGAAARGFRFRPAAEGDQVVRIPVVGRGELRAELNRALERAFGLVPLKTEEARHRQRGVCFAQLRVDRQRSLGGRHRQRRRLPQVS